jgi:hypothetical protein
MVKRSTAVTRVLCLYAAATCCLLLVLLLLSFFLLSLFTRFTAFVLLLFFNPKSGQTQKPDKARIFERRVSDPVRDGAPQGKVVGAVSVPNSSFIDRRGSFRRRRRSARKTTTEISSKDSTAEVASC